MVRRVRTILLCGVTFLASMQGASTVYVANLNSGNVTGVSGFLMNPVTGVLTSLPGSPYSAGTNPRSVVADPFGKFLYVLNTGSRNISAYQIDQNTGVPTSIAGSPFAVGTQPYWLAIHPAGKFLYVSDEADGISAFAINRATGALTPVPGSPFLREAPRYTIAADPTGRFIYAGGCCAIGVAVAAIDQTTGALRQIPGSPFETSLIHATGSLTADPLGRFVFATEGRYLHTLVVNPTTGALTRRGNAFEHEIFGGAVVDPTGRFLFALSNRLFNFRINSNGSFTTVAEVGSQGVRPVIDSTGRFLYAARPGVIGWNVDPVTGAMTGIPGSPFPAGVEAQSVAIAEIGVTGTISITPSRGGNAGDVTATLLGKTIQPGAKIELVSGSSRIVGLNTPLPTYGLAKTTFDLRGAVPGVRDLVITNPDGQQLTLPQGFTIDAGGAPDVKISKTGTTPVPGRILDYFITVENRGNIDASGVVSEALEPWFTFEFAYPTPTKVTQGEDGFPVPPPTPLYTDTLNWSFTLAPSQLSVFSYKAMLDATYPLGETVRGHGCQAPNQGDADTCNDFYHECKRRAFFAYSQLGPLGYRQELANCARQRQICFNGFFGSCDPAESPTSGPVDPNEKMVSHRKFIRTDQRLTYPIHYENIGSAEARDVFITDVLDPNLDSFTIQLLTPSATFETTTRTLKWSLLNANLPPKGIGNVIFSIEPKPNLPSGTEIRNTATIQFEVFPPVTTKGTVNIIDSTLPVCTVNALPAQTSSTSFPISWTGADVVGEVDSYSVFVSVNNSAFNPLLQSTKDKATTFSGQLGSTYRFYCTAVDTVGNAEIQVPSAEATTTIVSASSPGDVNADGVVDCRDIALVRAALGTRAGQPGWDARADVVVDGVIDVRDLAYVSQRLPVGTVCQ